MATTSFQLTAVIRPVEEGWVQASIQEIPGVITAAPTAAEARAMLADALHEYLLALGELEGQPDGEEGDADHSPLAVTLDV